MPGYDFATAMKAMGIDSNGAEYFATCRVVRDYAPGNGKTYSIVAISWPHSYDMDGLGRANPPAWIVVYRNKALLIPEDNKAFHWSYFGLKFQADEDDARHLTDLICETCGLDGLGTSEHHNRFTWMAGEGFGR